MMRSRCRRFGRSETVRDFGSSRLCLATTCTRFSLYFFLSLFQAYSSPLNLETSHQAQHKLLNRNPSRELRVKSWWDPNVYPSLSNLKPSNLLSLSLILYPQQYQAGLVFKSKSTTQYPLISTWIHKAPAFSLSHPPSSSAIIIDNASIDIIAPTHICCNDGSVSRW